MREIETQQQARDARKLDFCYLCTKSFDSNSLINREHVVAKTVFHPNDRDFPLILPSHKICNAELSDDDEAIGHLVKFLHSKDRSHHKLELTGYYEGHEMRMSTVDNLNMERIIWRWVRGFHSALYKQALADVPGTYSILSPLPEMELVDGALLMKPILPQHYQFTEELNRNLSAKNTDTIKCYNGQLNYECVWVKSDDGKPICLFCLNICDWSTLADELTDNNRTCLGSYLCGRIPNDASIGTNLIFQTAKLGGLNPFKKS